ncbi:MAG: leucyl aminopeptidase [Phycisphaerae bacterium]
MPSKSRTMFDFVAGSKKETGGDVLIVPLNSKPKPAMQLVSKIDAVCDDAVGELIEVGALADEVGALAHTTRSSGYRRVVIVSLGDDKELDAAKMRKAAASVVAWLQRNKIKQAALWIDALLSANFDNAVAEWCIGSMVGAFRYDEFRKPEPKTPDRVKIALRSAEAENITRVAEDVRKATLLSEAVNYSRAVAHRPPNVLNPTTVVDEARKLAKQHKLGFGVIDAKAARKMSMGGLLAVGAASEHPPCLIRLEYKGAPSSKLNHVIVGKTITFDTGGISIKPAAGMEAMKFDKCGGMVVLGLMRALASLKLKVNVTGILAAAENTLSDEAYRPSDILTMANGKTVEVTNTDAEGRLVLADALVYAQKECKPSVLIDLATLTGGVVTALGTYCAGLMTMDDTLAGDLEESGRRTHERVWRLPLWDEYFSLIKGGDADMKNSSGKRHAHPIVGGIFLKQFVEKGVPWAHLDIAGTATTDDDKGATGWGVRLLIDYLANRATS